VDGLSAEPFALAARRMLTPLQSPKPAVTVDVDATTQLPGQLATVTATVRNPSSDLTAENAAVTLNLPAGVALESGAATRSLGTLPTNSPTQTFTWTVRGTTDGLKQLNATATADRYGETFTATAADYYVVDGTGPAPTITVPGGRTTAHELNVGWWADDPSGVAHWDVDVATDNGAYTTWLSHTSYSGLSYPTTAGHTYRFRVRGTDSLGNVGGYVESAPTEVVAPATAPPPVGEPPAPTKPTKRNAHLTLRRAKRARDKLGISARVDLLATGIAGAKYTYKVGR
jgi:hypothetical protein